MKRAAGTAILLLLLATGAARADGEPKPQIPVSEAAWDARDLEGRWVLFDSAAGVKPGMTGDPWVPFLTRRKEWDLLEWIALATAEKDAQDALAEQNAPQWVRCAVWRLSVYDGHSVGAATRQEQHHQRRRCRCQPSGDPSLHLQSPVLPSRHPGA